MPLVARGAKRPRAATTTIPSYHTTQYQESYDVTAYSTDDALDLSVHDGARWTCNRRGKSFCHGLNAGTCLRTVNGNRCATNPEEVHQCSLCKKTGHGEHNCWVKIKGGGGGKGKVKGDGKPKGGVKTKGKGKGKAKKGDKGNGGIQ